MRALIFGLLILVILSSCASQRRCNRLYPPEIRRDSIVKDSIIIRDRIVYDTLAGDTSYILVDTSFINELPIQGKIVMENDYAMVKLRKENNKFRMELIQKDTILTRLLKGAEVEKSHTTEIIETKIIREKYIPGFYKFTLFWWIGSIILIILYIIWKYFRKFIRL